MAPLNRIEVVIDKVVYELSSSEPVEYIQSVANYIDRKIKSIYSARSEAAINPRLKTLYISLNIADDLFKEKNNVKTLETELTAFKEENWKLKKDIHSFKIEQEAVKSEIESAKAKIESAQAEISVAHKELAAAISSAEGSAAELSNTQTELASANKELKKLKQEIEKLKAELEEEELRRDKKLATIGGGIATNAASGNVKK